MTLPNDNMSNIADAGSMSSLARLATTYDRTVLPEVVTNLRVVSGALIWRRQGAARIELSLMTTRTRGSASMELAAPGQVATALAGPGTPNATAWSGTHFV
jgi:hypothetical protein